MEGVGPDQLDPILLTFDRGRAAQKAKYRRELFSAECTEGGSGMTFLDFFQLAKKGRPKGIIAFDIQEFL